MAFGIMTSSISKGIHEAGALDALKDEAEQEAVAHNDRQTAKAIHAEKMATKGMKAANEIGESAF